MTNSDEFEYARSLLPNEMYWGEPITVAAVLHIAEAARRTVSGQEVVTYLRPDGSMSAYLAAPIPATEQDKP